MKYFLLLFAIVAIYMSLGDWAVMDDAYICGTFAKNLVSGNGFTFNGNSIPAFSGVLFPALMIFFAWFMNPVVGVQIISIFVYLFGGMYLIRSASGFKSVVTLVWILPIFWLHVTSGLETIVFGILIIINFAGLFFVGKQGIKLIPLLLLAMIRFEGIIIALIFIGWYFIIRYFGKKQNIDSADITYRKEKDIRNIIIFFGILSLGIIAYITFYGFVLPTPYLLWAEINLFFILVFSVFLFGGAFAILPRFEDRHRPIVFISFIFIFFAAWLYQHGAFTGDYRYQFLMPFIPFFIFILTAFWNPPKKFTTILLFGIVLLFPIDFKKEFDTIKKYDSISTQLKKVGKTIDSLGVQSVVAVDVGHIAYYSKARIYDLTGSTSPDVFNKEIANWVLSKNPQVMVFPSRSNERFIYFKHRIPELMENKSIQEKYKFVGFFPHPIKPYVLFARNDLIKKKEEKSE